MRTTLADNTKRLMKAQGLNQSQLAKRSGIAQQDISRILRSKHSTTLDKLEGLAAGLDVRPWELLADDEETRREALRRMLGPASSRS